MLDDPDDRIREFSADALGREPDASLPPGTVEALLKKRDAEKSARVKAGDRICPDGAQQAGVAERLDAIARFHALSQLRITYLTELGQGGGRLPQYYPYLKSENTNVRRYLCDVLGNIANPAALEYVRPLIQDPKNDVITSAIRAVQILERYQKP